MQLVRNLWLGHARTLSRKAQEVVLAWVLERLTEHIVRGDFDANGLLPSEGDLARSFGVSRTVMVCKPLVELPHWSVAVQSRETTFAPPQLLLTLSL